MSVFCLHNSYKDCPSFDLDKLLEDVQNGLLPITAYHLLFPTHNTLDLLTKSSSSDKTLTTSSSFSSTVTNTDSDLMNSMQSIADFSSLYPTDPNSILSTNGSKLRSGTILFERSNLVINDSEHCTNDLMSTSLNNNSSSISLLNDDEKENRRIIDITCKLRIKGTRSCLVKIKQIFLFELNLKLSLLKIFYFKHLVIC